MAAQCGDTEVNNAIDVVGEARSEQVSSLRNDGFPVKI